VLEIWLALSAKDFTARNAVSQCILLLKAKNSVMVQEELIIIINA